MAQQDLNDVTLSDKEISLIRRLVLRELKEVEHRIAQRAHLPNVRESQWLADRHGQMANLEGILDHLSMPDTTRTAGTG